MSLVAQRRWIMPTKPGNVPDGIPALVAQVLACRGFADAEMATFLAARPQEDGPPMLDLDRAAERLRRALAARERIVVYGDKDLAGAGVALVLAKRLLGDLAYALRQDELLQLCALATVADVVPLRAANRVLTRAGLEALNRAPLVGIRALVERSGLKLGRVGAGEVGFVLGPRLNAAGRIADAEDALRLLLTEDAAEAKELAERLEQRNAERQELTRQVVAGARERAADRTDAWATIVADAQWPAGIVGLGASRLVEDYGRPAIVIAIDGDEGKGSCRSIAGVHIAEALADCDDILIKHGGHAMAAGFSVAVSRIPELVDRLDAIVRERLQGVRPVPTVRVDAEIAPELLTAKLAVELASLDPCGAGNPRPHLLVRDVRVYDIRQVGADADHLRCKVTVGRFTFDAMALRLRRGGACGSAPRLRRRIHHTSRRGRDARR